MLVMNLNLILSCDIQLGAFFFKLFYFYCYHNDYLMNFHCSQVVLGITQCLLGSFLPSIPLPHMHHWIMG